MAIPWLSIASNTPSRDEPGFVPAEEPDLGRHERLDRHDALHSGGGAARVELGPLPAAGICDPDDLVRPTQSTCVARAYMADKGPLFVADQALYVAKNGGRDRVAYFSYQMLTKEGK